MWLENYNIIGVGISVLRYIVFLLICNKSYVFFELREIVRIKSKKLCFNIFYAVVFFSLPDLTLYS